MTRLDLLGLCAFLIAVAFSVARICAAVERTRTPAAVTPCDCEAVRREAL